MCLWRLQRIQKQLQAFKYPFILVLQSQEHYSPELSRAAAGLGALLTQGLVSTVRISLSADPVEEIKAGA